MQLQIPPLSTTLQTPCTLVCDKNIELIAVNYAYLCSVTLEATGVGMFSDIFRGFLLQGRAYADDSPVGSFMAPLAEDLYRLSDCTRRDVSCKSLALMVDKLIHAVGGSDS